MKTMLHPDIEARIGAHYIFATLLNPPTDHSIGRNIVEHGKLQTKSSFTIASANALLEKLRREKESSGPDKSVLNVKDGNRDEPIEDDRRLGWTRKRSPNFYKISAPNSSTEAVSI